MNTHSTPEPSTVEAKTVDYAKYIPFATAGLIFLGVSRLMFYYAFFGIEIISFLEFGEIITSFLDIIVITFIATASCWVMLFRPKPIDSRNDKASPNKATKFFKGRLLSKKVILKGVILLCLLMIFLILYPFWKEFIILVSVLVVCYFAIRFVYKVYRAHPSKLIKDSSIIAIILIASETFIFHSAIIRYTLNKNKNTSLQTTIVFNDTYIKDSNHIFKTDSSNIYVGKTNNYIFIHHLKERVTSVYPMSSVVRIDVKNRPWSYIFKNFSE